MWVNHGSELPFVPAQPFQMWSGADAIAWRAAKYRSVTLIDGPGPDRAEYAKLNWDDASPAPGLPEDRCVMPVLRALHAGELRALVQLESGYLPIPKETWAPDAEGAWPIGWLLGQLDDVPFGDTMPRPTDLPFRGATVMFLDSEFKLWAFRSGKPVLPSGAPGSVTYQDVERWLKSFDCRRHTHEELVTRAQNHFAPRIVKPYHVKTARRAIEGEKRKRGPKQVRELAARKI